MSQVHPLARTTPRARTEIRASTASLTELAERYNITVATARKWKGREHAQDRSHRPHKLSTTLNPAQELLAVELRRTLLLPLDDLLAVLHEFINPDVSRSGLDRCMRWHGASDIKSLQPQIEGRANPYLDPDRSHHIEGGEKPEELRHDEGQCRRAEFHQRSEDDANRSPFAKGHERSTAPDTRLGNSNGLRAGLNLNFRTQFDHPIRR